MADYSNSKFEITRITPKIFKLRPFEGAEIDVDDLREMRSVYMRFSDNKPFAVLLDATSHFTATEAANKLLVSNEFTNNRMAVAFVTSSLANKLFGNFFIQFHRPASPTKIFKTEAGAMEWLELQIKNYEESKERSQGVVNKKS